MSSQKIYSPDRRQWLRSMLLIRCFEDKVQQLFMQGLVPGTTHLCQGQEAVSVGAISAITSADYLTITYRGHGQALARGVDPEVAFAELMGRETGLCKGRGGSMHFCVALRALHSPSSVMARPISEHFTKR